MNRSPIVTLRGIRKSFGATRALKGVDLEVLPGEVHAVIGENGAGKSTLMKIMSGAHPADEGDMTLCGEPFTPANPHAAQEAGVGMVYQELNLAPHLSVRENLLLGMDVSRGGFIRDSVEKEMARAALERLGHPGIDLGRQVNRLSIAEQQVVEIARSCLRNVRLLILDEPTSSLGQADVRRLFQFVRELRNSGVGIIYISHFLEECREVADRFTVLRDGETVGTGSMEAAGIEEMIRMMVGRNLGDIYPGRKGTAGDSRLKVDQLSGKVRPVDMSLELCAGEIVGVAGLIGAGRTELLRGIFGLDRRRKGDVLVAGTPVAPGRPDLSLQAGVGLLSENRKEEGLYLNQSLTDNMLITRLKRYQRSGLLSAGRMRDRAGHWVERLRINAPGVDSPVDRLSGGNQQKVALARLLEHEASVLLLDEPTRGIDVQSKAQIYRLIAELADAGKAILIVSSYLPELLGMCDRIAVMRRGRCVAIKDRKEWTEESLLAAAIGGTAS
jgi:ribose transport system ATP-binding protein